MRMVGHSARTLATAVRAVAIVVVALLCVATYAVTAVRRLWIRDRVAREQHRARSRGRILRWAFTRLGATFIKIGQVASTRADLFAAPVIDELRLLQDRVPPFGARRVRAVVQRELGAPLALRFREFDPIPVAAGSIAQVHHAVLHDGHEVAVKVLRPGVRARVRRDSTLLLWLAHVAHAVSARARAADVIGHARSLSAGIFAQTELLYEGRNSELFRHEFAGSQSVAFPRVYAELSTRDVLTMEFIHGVSIDLVPPAQIPKVTLALRDAFFAMCFDHGVVHADLHPGNVLVRQDGVVVLLDAGLVKHLSSSVVDQVVDFARCMVIGDAQDLVLHLQSHHRYLEHVDWNAVVADATTFIASLRVRSIAELEVSVVVARLFELARKHHIRPMPELSLVLLGMVTIEGIAKRLDPSANTMTEIARFLAPRIAQRSRLARGSRDWPADRCNVPTSGAPGAGTAMVPYADVASSECDDEIAFARTPTRTLH